MRLLTAQEFAIKKDLHITTILKWIREGRVEGVITEGRKYLIPEKNLSLEFNPRKKRKFPQTEEEAREAYNSLSQRRIKFDYDELRRMFEDGMTIMEIGFMAGVSRQRIQQLYAEFFALGQTGYARRNEINQAKMREKALASAADVEKLAYMSEVLESVELSMEIVQRSDKTKCYSDIAWINNHKCRIYISRKDSITCKKSRQAYSKLSLAKHIMNKYEFIIIIAGESERRIFVIPSKDLIKQFRKKEDRKMFYLPTVKLNPYNKNFPSLDWWIYEDAWDLLKVDNEED